MKQLFRLLIPAFLILLFCLPLMAQTEKDYPNFQLLSEAEQSAYDRAPSNILPDARAAFSAAKYDRAIALCNYHYIYYGDKISEMPGGADELREKNELESNAKRCYDFTREMDALLKKGDISVAKDRAVELLLLNKKDEHARQVLVQKENQVTDTGYETVQSQQIEKTDNVVESQKTSEATQKKQDKPSPVVSEHYYAYNPEYLAENLKFNSIKSNYNKRDYKGLTNPRYSPALAWLNLILPGLAQFSMGESGPGLKYLGIGMGCSLVTTVGVLLSTDPDYNDLSIITFGVGAIAGLFNGIASITNASKMAKIKSLYYDDMTHWPSASRSYGFDLQIEPTLQTAVSPQGYCIAPGVGMRLTF